MSGSLAPQPHPASAKPTPPAGKSIPPGHVAVLCPAGFNATSVKTVDPKKAVYARVTYRPH
ncbi:MAG: hypothetical protein KF715_16465 [Candidatus Didemnitutus sp.]|nr:hypothetical protein [Candidatus Didemnitutus sp.]